MPIRHARLDRPSDGAVADPATRELERRLEHAIDDERRRTGRDLHAGVLQRLAATRMHLSTMIEAGDGTRVLADIAEGLDLAAAELRATIASAEPALVATRGIGAAIASSQPTAGQRLRVDDRLARRHPMRVELAVYFACREAIQNAMKHAGPAAGIVVELTDAGAGVRFCVADDGVGFDALRTTAGVGLLNIRERVGSAGGSVEISTHRAAGTIVVGFVPDVLTEARDDEASPTGRAAGSHAGPAPDRQSSLRRQIVLETDAERRRIMRDLHDGAQQRLVAVRVKVSVATERAAGGSLEQAALERTGTELDLAIAELRDLARGLLTTSQRPVAPALRSVTRHWPMKVSVRERNVQSGDRTVDAAVYACVLETLQHARAQSASARASSAVVTLVGATDAVHFTVRGHGSAFDLRRTAALDSAEHVLDRAYAAGGSLSYRQMPDRGVLIRGTIPVTSGA